MYREEEGRQAGIPSPPLVSVAKPPHGTRAHRVVRSSDPNRFDSSEGVSVTDGSYSEGLSDNSDLVFYRID